MNKNNALLLKLKIVMGNFEILFFFFKKFLNSNKPEKLSLRIFVSTVDPRIAVNQNGKSKPVCQDLLYAPEVRDTKISIILLGLGVYYREKYIKGKIPI